MRMLMKAQIPTPAGNKAIADGKMGESMGAMMARLKPEAVYFTLEDGMRTVLIFFDLAETADMPRTAEDLFMGLDAKIDMTPVMTPDELQTGLARL